MAQDGIMVVGGTGALGHFVVRALLARGIRPVVVSASGNKDLLTDVLDRITLVRGDVRDRAAIAQVVADHRPQAIAHLGATVNAITEADPPAAIRVGAEGTANVLDAARASGVRRVIYASAKAVYGPALGRFGYPTFDMLTEDLPPNPLSVYAITKLAGEGLGRWYMRNHGIEFAALRFGSTLGPGKLRHHGNTSGMLSRILESAMADAPIIVEKGGEAVTDVVFNGDAAAAIVGALFAPVLNHSVYNVATGSGITLHDFAAAVRRRFPKADITIGPGPQYLRSDSAGHCILDISRACADFGYAPSTDLDWMIDEYLAVMKVLGLAPG